MITLGRVLDVINSCESYNQFVSAVAYVDLFMDMRRKHVITFEDAMRHHLLHEQFKDYLDYVAEYLKDKKRIEGDFS